MLFLTGIFGLLVAGLAVGVMPSEETAEDDTTEPAQTLRDDGGMAGEISTIDDTGMVDPGPGEDAGTNTVVQDDTGNVPDDPPTDTDTAPGGGAGAVTDVPGDEPTPEPSPEASGGDDVLWGDLFADTIEGGNGNDQIDGYGGDDSLSGGAGDDSLLGDAGSDRLSGGEGNDSLQGGDGADTLSGDAGADTLAGGLGDDSLTGGEAADSLLGGAGGDRLDGGAGADSLEGNDGHDTLTGGAGADELSGGNGDDLLVGVVSAHQNGNTDTDSADFLNGGSGADTLMIGAGDTASGGEEGDLFALGEWIDPATPATIADYIHGSDQIVVVYDPDSGVTPEVTLEPSETAGNLWVALNGVRLAEVAGADGLTVEDILLITPAEFGAV